MMVIEERREKNTRTTNGGPCKIYDIYIYTHNHGDDKKNWLNLDHPLYLHKPMS